MIFIMDGKKSCGDYLFCPIFECLIEINKKIWLEKF
jgi:hypothetical protein